MKDDKTDTRNIRDEQAIHDIGEREGQQTKREQLLAQSTRDREAAEELVQALERERVVLDTTMEHTHAQLAYLDPQFNFVRVNSAYARGSGYAAQDLVGRNHFELFPHTENQAIFERVRDTGQAAVFHAKPFTFPDRPELGTTYWDWTLVPVMDASGNVTGLVLSLLDVSASERARLDREAQWARQSVLIDVSERILAEETVQGVLEHAVAAARKLSGARLAVSGFFADGHFQIGPTYRAEGVSSCLPGETFTIERGGVYLDLVKGRSSMRLTDEEMRRHPDWWGLPKGHVPLRGFLGVRLVGYEGRTTGLIMLSDKTKGDFSGEDEALLLQLASLVSLALQHIEAREDAERRADELDAVFDAMLDAVIVYDADGVVTRANRAATTTIEVDPAGVHRAQLIQAFATRTLDGRPAAVDELPSTRALRGETVTGERFVIRSAQGNDLITLVSATPLWKEGVVSGVVLLWHDVTESVLARQALDVERARLRAIIENAPEGILVANGDGDISLTNPAADRIYGSAVLRGQDHSDRASPSARYPDGTPCDPRDLPVMRAALDGETCHNVEMALHWPDGARRDLLASSTPIRDSEGRISGAVGILHDVTEVKQTQEVLRRYADRLELLREADRAILASSSAEEIGRAVLPYLRQLVPCTWASVTTFDRQAGQVSLLAAVTSGGSEPERGWRAPLEEAWFLSQLRPGQVYVEEHLEGLASSPLFESLWDGRGQGALVSVPLVFRDQVVGSLNLGTADPDLVTPQRLNVLFEIADQLTIGIRQAGLHDQVQRHADELEQLVAQRTAALETSQARLRAVYDGALLGIVLVGGDGCIVESNPAFEEIVGYSAEELRGRDLDELAHPDSVHPDLDLFEALMAGQLDRYHLEKRYIHKDGRAVWVALSVTAIRAGEGRPRLALKMVEDITEKRRAQQALIQAEKLSATGRLAASLAHEINNPLQAVIGCLDLLEGALAQGQDPGRYLEVAQRELGRAARVVGRLRDLHRRAAAEEREDADVNALIEHMLEVAAGQCKRRRIEVEWCRADDLPSILAVPDQLQQVFLNLILNAVDAMPDGGQLQVSTARTDTPEGVAVRIADTGVGISAEHLPRLFEPFYTTRPDGLGLGLYVSRNIVEQHGGRVEVESTLGGGTAFTVWLPLGPSHSSSHDGWRGETDEDKNSANASGGR